MSGALQVRLISAAEAQAIRLPVLRAGMAPEAAVFDGDYDHETRHFGAFSDERLAGVASLFRAPFPERPELKGCMQLRGMAVSGDEQRKGVGRALLDACVRHAIATGADALWCNARTPARSFYEKAGWSTVGAEFEIPAAGPHFRMWRRAAD